MDQLNNASIDKDSKEKRRKEIFDWIKTIAIALIVGILLRLIVFEVVIVEQSSMSPTILEGQRLFLSKLSYTFSEPQRGDIIVLKANDQQNYKKRVIALEGETIQIKDSRVYINGELLQEDYIDSSLVYPDFSAVRVPEGCVFVMGDNRPSSIDSRSSSLGFVSYDDIIGRVLFRLSPFTLFSR